MDRKNPGPIKYYSTMRVLAAILLLTASCGVAGCITSQLKATSNRPVETTMNVFTHASIMEHRMDSACLFRFSAPHEMAAASPMLTGVFEERLVQRATFAHIRVVPDTVDSDAQALWYARKAGCSIAILPSLLYMMGGAGGMPTRLVVRIRVLDAATGQLLWDIKQSAWSNPGPDIDLTWNTIVGAPAQRCRVLADCLARKFAGYFAQLLQRERKQEARVQQ